MTRNKLRCDGISDLELGRAPASVLFLFKEVNYFLKQRNVMFISWDHLLTRVKLARCLQSNSTVQAGRQTRLVMNYVFFFFFVISAF